MKRFTGALACMRVAKPCPTTSRLVSLRSQVTPSHATARFFCSSPRHLEENRAAPELVSAGISPPKSSSKAPSDFAFAFDIDGVLYRGGTEIPGAGKTLEWLASEDVRYVFLTNGGGNHENMKAESLRKKLGVDKQIIDQRVIQSHTPMQGWPAHIKKNDTILITGQHPHWARRVAYEYGFKNVITPSDLHSNNLNMYPFRSPRQLTGKKDRDGRLKMPLDNSTMPLPHGKKQFVPEDPYQTDIPASALKIDHIFVWNDPRDWSFDIQIIHDALVSHQGYIGTLSPKNGDKSLPNNGWQQDGQPSLWISNLDLLWKTEYPISRFGTGAFVEALKAVWSAYTDGAELQYQAFGKPLKRTYDYAHHKLLHMGLNGEVTEQPAPVKRVYMIGDNPESDIRGANEFKPEDGTEWKSILVRTGVWSPTALESEPRHKPDVIVDDVAEAIVWAMKNEGIEVSPGRLEELRSTLNKA